MECADKVHTSNVAIWKALNHCSSTLYDLELSCISIFHFFAIRISPYEYDFYWRIPICTDLITQSIITPVLEQLLDTTRACITRWLKLSAELACQNNVTGPGMTFDVNRKFNVVIARIRKLYPEFIKCKTFRMAASYLQLPGNRSLCSEVSFFRKVVFQKLYNNYIVVQ